MDATEKPRVHRRGLLEYAAWAFAWWWRSRWHAPW